MIAADRHDRPQVVELIRPRGLDGGGRAAGASRPRAPRPSLRSSALMYPPASHGSEGSFSSPGRAGKTFAEVGGLWGTTNERASVAHRAGARDLTMVDLSPADSKWWPLFEARRIQFGVPPVRSVSGDVMQLV